MTAMCAVLSFSFYLTNCEVEDKITTTAENNSSSVTNTPDLISFTIQGAQNQTEVITMLKFASWEHFDSTANQLSEELEIYNDAFWAAKESLGEEELDELSLQVAIMIRYHKSTLRTVLNSQIH
jgi:hypothetical protein